MLDDNQYFTSSYAKDWLHSSESYHGLEFHFHQPAEHTIDGKTFDLEMHTVHQALEDVDDQVIGYKTNATKDGVTEIIKPKKD